VPSLCVILLRYTLVMRVSFLGRDTLAQLQERPYDVIGCDLPMPGLAWTAPPSTHS